jgi:hypothetical protein
MKDKTAVKTEGVDRLGLETGDVVEVRCRCCCRLCDVPLGIFGQGGEEGFVCVSCDDEALERPEIEITGKGERWLRSLAVVPCRVPDRDWVLWFKRLLVKGGYV